MQKVQVLIVIIFVITATPTLGNDLTTAIDSGYVDQVTEILRQAPERLNQKNESGLTPLNQASYEGHIEIVKLLLDLGADVAIGDNENSQPIHNAAVAGHTDVIELLSSRGADINAQDDNGNTPLLFALMFRHQETAQYLIGAGADINISNNDNVSPLHYSALREQLELLKIIISRGANLNQKSRSGRTALSFAAGSNYLEIVEYLLKLGADTEIPEDYGRTPLLWVARETGNADMAALLIRYGANVNARDRGDDTPLVLAAWRGFSGIVNLLLDNGAIVETSGNNSQELLNYSIEKGLDRLFTQLAKSDVDLHIKSRIGGSLLHSAAQGGSVNIINTFLEQGFDITDSDIYGWTPLHYAAWKGRTQGAQLLIENGADMNARTLSGLSPYNLADSKNREGVKSLLILRGADQNPQKFPKLTDPYFGQTPPGIKPELFAPDIVSTNRHGHSAVAFSPDGTKAYWSSYFFPVDSGYAEGAIVYSRIENGQWTIPEFPEFTQGLETNDDVPVFSQDGSRLYFLSRRPLTPDGQRTKKNVWIVDKNESGWGEPYLAPGELNNLNIHWQFTFSNSGTIYIQGERDDSHGLTDIYKSEFVNGEFQTPTNVGSIINTPSTETCPYIASDESFLLFASGGHDNDDDNNQIYIYISFKTDEDQWSQPISTGLEGLCPLISPDEKYLFYNGRVNGIGGIYWVEASILEELKPDDL